MRRLCCVIVCSLLAGQGIVTASSFDETWPAIVRALQKGEVAATTTELQSARQTCQKLLATSTLSAPERALVRHALAYANWRLVRVPGLRGAERDALLQEALNQIGEVTTAEPKNAEAYALRSSIYGAQISFSPMMGVTIGQDAAEAMERALQLAPNNPRVLLQDAVRLYHTPAMWGGDTARAEATLRKAIAVFATEPEDRPWPNWGRPDAHIWLGQILAKRGDIAGARAEYQRALAVSPENAWVKEVLLPALDKRKPR